MGLVVLQQMKWQRKKTNDSDRCASYSWDNRLTRSRRWGCTPVPEATLLVSSPNSLSLMALWLPDQAWHQGLPWMLYQLIRGPCASSGWCDTDNIGFVVMSKRIQLLFFSSILYSFTLVGKQ
jgi:hypothetical protein